MNAKWIELCHNIYFPKTYSLLLINIKMVIFSLYKAIVKLTLSGKLLLWSQSYK